MSNRLSRTKSPLHEEFPLLGMKNESKTICHFIAAFQFLLVAVFRNASNMKPDQFVGIFTTGSRTRTGFFPNTVLVDIFYPGDWETKHMFAYETLNYMIRYINGTGLYNININLVEIFYHEDNKITYQGYDLGHFVNNQLRGRQLENHLAVQITIFEKLVVPDMIFIENTDIIFEVSAIIAHSRSKSHFIAYVNYVGVWYVANDDEVTRHDTLDDCMEANPDFSPSIVLLSKVQ